MTGVVVNPSHGLSSFERLDAGGVRAWCLCGACWEAPAKSAASKALHKHMSAEARELRKARNEIRRQGIGSGDQLKEVP